MQAGKLRHRIEIKHLIADTNEYGYPIQRLETFATVWAEMLDLKGREFWQAAQVASEVTTRIRIRYLNGLDASMSVFHAGREFSIDHIVDPDGRRRELHLMCKTVDGPA